MVRALPLVFAVFWSSVLVWQLLLGLLARGLRARHPLVYESLVHPAWVAPTSPIPHELVVLRFLVAGRDQFLGDGRLSRLCGVMRAFLVSYLAFFFLVPGWLAR